MWKAGRGLYLCSWYGLTYRRGTEEVQTRYRRGTRDQGDRRERIMNKEQGMMNIEGRKCSMLNFQYSMFNEERWNWELGYWGLGESRGFWFHAETRRV
ncbi:hypothetical protein SY85_11750 [Flavisolibacter tropicus]|uniref:Uncharacterized protein n=1 Tax=Flavisolibacter tropicus TaxID=1492898 RepID=A0A172TVG7_9BACT|nr:hypothetical protein SY85_11750 [Flavisolibacter tropicus]